MEITIKNEMDNKQTSLEVTEHSGTRSLGTTLISADQPRTVIKDQKANMLATRANHHLQDNSWTLSDQLSRNNWVGDISWPVTAVNDTVLATYDVPYSFLISKLSQTPFETFQFVKFDTLSIHVQIQANHFAAGRLILYYYPYCKPDDEINALKEWDTRCNRVLVQHQLLDPSLGESAEFKIPFTYNKGWIDLTRGDTLGSFRIAVLNQLQIATGTSTSCTVRLFMSMDGAEFKVPVAAKPPAPLLPRKGKKYAEFGEAQAGLLGDISKTVSDTTKALMPFAEVVDFIGTILDKKQITVQYPPLVTKDQQYMTNSENDEYIERLSWKPSEMQLTDKEHYGTSVDEMSLDYLFSDKWNIISTGSYSVTNNPGDQLFKMRVGPMGLVSPADTTELTTIDYISRRFRYWRGSFILGLEFVTCPIHEGRITVAFLPATNYTDVPLDYGFLMSQYMSTFQLKGGQNTFAVKIPYLAQTPYKRVYSGQTLTSGPLSVEQNYFNGTVVVIADTQLKVMQSVPTTIQYNVYLAAGSDYEIITPTIYNSSVSTVLDYATVGESQSLDNRKATESKTVSFSDSPQSCSPVMLCADPSSVVTDGWNYHFGEHVNRLQPMLKRYSSVIRERFSLNDLILGLITEAEAASIEQGFIPLIFPLISTKFIEPESTGLGNARNFFSEVLAMYRLARAPLVFKIKGSGFSYGYISYYDPNEIAPGRLQNLNRFFPKVYLPPASPVIGGPILPLAYFSPTHVGEVRLPFLHQQATTIVKKPYDVGAEVDFNNHILFVALYGITSLTQDIEIDIVASLSDEATFGLFIGLPPVLFETESNGGSSFPDDWLPPTPPPTTTPIQTGLLSQPKKEKELLKKLSLVKISK